MYEVKLFKSKFPVFFIALILISTSNLLIAPRASAQERQILKGGQWLLRKTVNIIPLPRPKISQPILEESFEESFEQIFNLTIQLLPRESSEQISDSIPKAPFARQQCRYGYYLANNGYEGPLPRGGMKICRDATQIYQKFYQNQ